MAMRVLVRSINSSAEIAATVKPFCAVATAIRSAASRDSASRTAPGLKSNSAAASLILIFAPGCNRQDRIASRKAA